MKIVILGAGNMGSWLAIALSKKQHQLFVYDTVMEKAGKLASNNKAITVLNAPVDIAKFNPDMLVNAVSLPNTIAAFENCLSYISAECVLCDIASVKTGLPEYYRRNSFRFVSLHPMFGPVFANMDSLQEENVVVINESDPVMAGFFRSFFEQLGVNIFEYSFEEHDSKMAYSLTIPFVSSMVFAACVDSTSVPGTTFSRHIKIARGLLSENNHLLAEILFNPHSLDKLEKITSRLEYLKHIIKGMDIEEINKFFDKLRKNIER